MKKFAEYIKKTLVILSMKLMTFRSNLKRLFKNETSCEIGIDISPLYNPKWEEMMVHQPVSARSRREALNPEVYGIWDAGIK